MSARSTAIMSSALVEILENVRDAAEGPMLVHVVTKKGKGYAPGRGGGRQISRRRRSSTSFRASRTRGRAAVRRAIPSVFAKALLAEAASATEKSCAITAAMPSGTGLDKFGARIPRPHVRRRHRRAACA